MLILGTIIFITLVGIALSIWAWRGERVDDHPLCHHCSFDLYGSPGAATCPECGAKLDSPQSIRYGNRRRRKGWLATGVVLMLLTVTCGTVVGLAMLSGPKAWKLMPACVVRWDAYYLSGSLALNELNRRLSAGLLTQPQINAAVSDALKVQGNLKRPWSPQWGDLVDKAHQQGKLTKKLWLRYASQMLRGCVKARFRRTVHQGGRLPYRLSFSSPRCGRQCDLWFSQHRKSFTLDKVTHKLYPHGFSEGVLNVGGDAWDGYVKVPKATPLGKQSLVFRLRCNTDLHPQPVTEKILAIAQYTYVFDRQITIVPENQPTAHAVTDPKQQVAVKHAIRVKSIDIGGWKSSSPHDPVIFVSVEVDPRPVDVAFDLTAHDQHGHVWHFGSDQTVALSAHDARTVLAMSKPMRPLPGSFVDLVLTPSRRAAENSVDAVNYWNKPIVFKHVKVNWSIVPKDQRPPGVNKTSANKP